MVEEGYIPKEGDIVTHLGYTLSLESGAKRKTLFSPLRSIDSTVANFSSCQDKYWNWWKKGRTYRLENGKQFCVNLRDADSKPNPKKASRIIRIRYSTCN